MTTHQDEHDDDPLAGLPTEIMTGVCESEGCQTRVEREVPIESAGLDKGDLFLVRTRRTAPLFCPGCVAEREQERRDAEQRERDEADRRRRREKVRERTTLLVASGLPKMLARWTFDAIEGDADPAGLAAVRRWVDAFVGPYRPARTDDFLQSSRFSADPLDRLDGIDEIDYTGNPAAEPPAWGGPNPEIRGLLLTGKVGIGKSTLLGAAVRELADRAQPVLWVSTSELFNLLDRGFGDAERQAALGSLIEPLPLVLDDVDKTTPSERSANVLYTALEVRINAGLPIALTTNLRLAEMRTKWPEPWGETITSRLAGYCEIVNLDGTDRRVQRARQHRDELRAAA